MFIILLSALFIRLRIALLITFITSVGPGLNVCGRKVYYISMGFIWLNGNNICSDVMYYSCVIDAQWWYVEDCDYDHNHDGGPFQRKRGDIFLIKPLVQNFHHTSYFTSYINRDRMGFWSN